MGRKVFVSYTATDVSLARRVAKKLEKAGLEAVLPAVTVVPGDQIMVKIADALRQSDAVLVIASGDSIHSAGLYSELGAAVALRKPVYVLTHEVEPNQLPDVLRYLQRASLKHSDRYLRKLAKTLKTEA